ncbi:MAG: MTH1187 family thiamine-binding protein [Ignavibacteria bacterium]
MKAIVDVSIIPLGVGLSLSPYVAECEKIFKEAGLKTVLHANGTNIEGDWDKIFEAIKKCHERLHQMGVPRISTNMRVGTRIDKEQTMMDKIKSVEEKLI